MPKQDANYTPTVWTKTVDGKTQERTAHRIDDEVAFRFDGWLPKGKSAGDADKNAAAAVAASDTSSKSTNQK